MTAGARRGAAAWCTCVASLSRTVQLYSTLSAHYTVSRVERAIRILRRRGFTRHGIVKALTQTWFWMRALFSLAHTERVVGVCDDPTEVRARPWTDTRHDSRDVPHDMRSVCASPV